MKKTITIEFTFKKWMKLALLAVVFLLMSYLFMTGANAQVLTTTTSGTVQSLNCCTLYSTAPQKPPDPGFRQVWFVLVSIAFLIGTVGAVASTIATWNDEKEE